MGAATVAFASSGEPRHVSPNVLHAHILFRADDPPVRSLAHLTIQYITFPWRGLHRVRAPRAGSLRLRHLPLIGPILNPQIGPDRMRGGAAQRLERPRNDAPVHETARSVLRLALQQRVRQRNGVLIPMQPRLTSQGLRP